MSETIRLGARIRAARKAAGFRTSKEYLKKFKIPASTYSQHESGARIPDDETIKFYCKTFKVNFNWLKNGEGLPFNNKDSYKKNIVDEELIDLNSIHQMKAGKNAPKLLTQSTIINTKLLEYILIDLLHFYNERLAKNITNSIAKETIKIYNKVVSSTSSYKSQMKLLKEIIASRKF